MKKFFLALSLVIQSSVVLAAPRTVILSVPDMTCAACPITVKTALSRVKGVTVTKVLFNEHQAVVTFNDQQTNVNQLIKATTEAGYPSHIQR